MASNLAKSGAVKNIITKLSRNQHTLQKVFNKKSFPAFRQTVCDTNPYAFNSYYWKSKNHFFGSKNKAEQENQKKQQEEKNEKEEAKNQQEKAEEKTEEKPEQKKTESKNGDQPETIESLTSELPAETKKKILALWKKLEEENIVNAKKLKECNEIVQTLEKANNDARTKLGDLRDRLKEEIEERELMRKRYEKEIDNTKVYAITKFAKDLLEVPDNLDRALEAAKKLEETGDPLFEGVKQTRSILLHILSKHGINQINPKGEVFDPNKHEALFDFIDPNQVPGTCGVVCTIGYSIQDRILRPAKVGVVKEPEQVEGKN